MSVSLSLRAYLVDTNATSANGMRPVLAARGAHTLRGLLRQDPGASTVPWVGGWPAVVHDVGGVNDKVTIVVLADGYALADQRAFEARVQQVTTDLFTIDLCKDNTASFRVVRLGLVSAESPLSDCHGIKDTAVGLVFTDLRTDAGFDSWTPEIYVRVRKALRTWRLDGDIVMVQVNHGGNWGVFRDGLMALTTGVATRVLAHELGHAFGLADEYVNAPNPVAYPGTTSPLAPNVTDNVERLTLKWRAFVKPTTPIPTTVVPPGWNRSTDVGAFEGGLRDYDTGIYHPALDCKMNDDRQPFCPVCADAVSKALRYALDHGGRPEGGGAGGASDVRVLLRVDGTGAHTVIDVSPAWPERLRPMAEAGAAADVAYVGDEVVGYGPVLADTPSHLFGGDLPEGEVHAVLPHADDVIELRIPAARWAGIDPSGLRVGRVVLGGDVGARPWMEAVTAESVTEVRAPRLVEDVSALVEAIGRIAGGDQLRVPAWRPDPQ